MMKELLEKAKLVTKYTNNSLRAYSITKLFQISVPDKLIMERSGHRVTEGLREYHRMNVLQELQVCTALDRALIQKTKLLLYGRLLLLSLYQGSMAVHLTIAHFSLLHYHLYPKRQMQQFLTTTILLTSPKMIVQLHTA